MEPLHPNFYSVWFMDIKKTEPSPSRNICGRCCTARFHFLVERSRSRCVSLLLISLVTAWSTHSHHPTPLARHPVLVFPLPPPGVRPRSTLQHRPSLLFPRFNRAPPISPVPVQAAGRRHLTLLPSPLPARPPTQSTGSVENRSRGFLLQYPLCSIDNAKLFFSS